MSSSLLTLRQVATILQISLPRVYQMDDVLKPIVTRRGTKTKTRQYRVEVVERVRVARASSTRFTTIPASAEQAFYRQHVRAAARIGLSFRIDLEDFTHVASLNCLFCGQPPLVREISGGRHVALNDVIRIVHDQPASRDNAAPCCALCLYAKGELDTREYIARCRRIVSRQAELGFF